MSAPEIIIEDFFVTTLETALGSDSNVTAVTYRNDIQALAHTMPSVFVRVSDINVADESFQAVGKGGNKMMRVNVDVYILDRDVRDRGTPRSTSGAFDIADKCRQALAGTSPPSPFVACIQWFMQSEPMAEEAEKITWLFQKYYVLCTIR